MIPALSVVVPMLDERDEIEGAIASAWQAGADEVVVVDGGSTDGSRELVRPPARLLDAPRGRARQIRAGLRACAGDIVLILHADSRLPPHAGRAVRDAIAAGAVGGAFHKRFASSHPLLRHARWRTRTWWSFGLSFGDQAQFARRDVLLSAGLPREGQRAEDMDLALLLRKHGRCVLLPDEVTTSARRLLEHGILRTWASWWLIALARLARGGRLG